MLKKEEIWKIVLEVGIKKEEISNEALVFLEEGAKKYWAECKKYLDHEPSAIEAKYLISHVLKRSKELAEKESSSDFFIEVRHIKKICDELPYPFDLWFC